MLLRALIDTCVWLDLAKFNSSQQSRSLSEILEAEHLLFRQVWYNRHQNLRINIEDGEVKVVPRAS